MDKKSEPPGTVELSVSDLDKILDGNGDTRGDDGAQTSSEKPKAKPSAVPPLPTTKAADDLPCGRIIDDRYEVQEQLGVGAMGTVFLVTHLRLNKPFALKVVNPDLARQPEYVARFEREANACSLLDHPNCISVTDFGHTDDGILYLVMDYVDGVALSDIAKDTPTPLAEALEYTRQILVGLEHAHGKGLIHRDVKLENILKCHRENDEILIKILDFGMAKPTVNEPDNMSITQRGIVLGTPQYIGPELIRNQEADERCDLYSVGVCLYRMITGKVVFQGNTTLDMLAAKMKRPAPSLKDATSLDYPEALESFIKRALQREPQHRFSSATQMLKELEQVKAAIDRDPPSDNPRTDTGTKKRALIGLAIAVSILALVAFFVKGLSSFDTPTAHPANPNSTITTSFAKGTPLPGSTDEQKSAGAGDHNLHPVLLEAKLLIERKKCRAAHSTLESSIDTLGNQTARGYFLLGRSSMCIGDPKEALVHYKNAIETDDQYRKDGIIAEDVKRMLSMKKVRQDAMDFMKDAMGDAAMPTLIHLAGHHPNMDVRHQALAHVESAGMLEHVNMAVSLDWDLNQTASCTVKRKVVAKLGELGTSSAKQVLLRARDAQKRTGLFRREYVHACVRGDIAKALSTMRIKKEPIAH